jgi:hypothetical protein
MDDTMKICCVSLFILGAPKFAEQLSSTIPDSPDTESWPQLTFN